MWKRLPVLVKALQEHSRHGSLLKGRLKLQVQLHVTSYCKHYGVSSLNGIWNLDRIPVITGTSRNVHLGNDEKYREHFIPFTKKSLVCVLMQDGNLFCDDDDKIKLEMLASSFHDLLANHYHIFYQEIKALFDLLDPDKDTLLGKKSNLHERLDREYWLIRKLSFILERANFIELPQHVINNALQHVTKEKVKVSVDHRKYAVMKFWVLGQDVPPATLPWYHSVSVFVLEHRYPAFVERYKSRLKPARPLKFYKRVITAVRLKTDHKLTLKAYKDVPINSLEKLLPHGCIDKRNTEKYLISGSLSLAALGVLAHVVTRLDNVTLVLWPIISTGVATLIALVTHILYYKKVANFLSDTSRMLYFKNIASNQTVLNLVVRRAEEELFKEMLLTYSFLLAESTSPSKSKNLAQNGCISQSILETSVQDWVFQRVGVRVHFDASRAVLQLEKLGLLRREADNNISTVLSLELALAKLPEVHKTIATHSLEDDLLDGYDKHLQLDNLMAEEKRRSRYGWK